MRMKKIRLLFLTLVALIAGAASSSAKTVYFQPNSNWLQDGARFALYMCVSGGEGGEWTDFAIDDADNNIYVATFNDDYPNMIICRMNPNNPENNWDNAWNQTADLSAPDADNLLYILADGQWSGATVGNGLTTEDHTDPLSFDYYVEGDAALISAGWNATENNKMTWTEYGNFQLFVENVLLTAGTEYNYKVWCDNGSENGIWYPENENKTFTVDETGYYNVDFMFDPNGNVNAEVMLQRAVYLADFNLGSSFSTTSDPFFSIARDWKHIAEAFDDDGDPRYMTYTYYNNQGVNDTGTILAYKQYASESGYSSNGQVVHDMLVSPLVWGEVTLQVKASTAASSSYPSFIEFYAVNENGTEYGEQFGVEYYDADGNPADGLSTTEWVTAKINVGDATRIGIRGQYVYMDNFVAEEATVMPEKKLKIASATPTATTGTIKWDQQPNGKVLVKYTVTVTNTGETDFAVGDEGYSVSIYNRKTGDVYGTTEVPVALAPNATSDEFDVTAEVEPTIWPNSYTYINMDLKENISGSFVQRAQSTYNEYAPKFVFRAEGSTSTSNLYGDIAFGKISEETSKSYEIYNDGTAPLQVKTITVPEGFTVNNAGNFTVAAKEKQVITITLPVTATGIFSGNLEIVYVDKTGADASYTKAVTGTVLDASKNIITFDDGQGNAYYPQGSVRYNVYISSEGVAPDKNYYLQNGYSGNMLYITPLMTAEEGESITFDAMYSSYSGNKVEVMISTDRQNWTTIQTISNIASQYNWTTYTATIPEAGNYYLGFKLTSAKVDNIYGLVYAPAPAHDLLLIGSEVPATGTQNADYTAKVKVGNVGPNAEAAGTYTASLYVDGEEVATANDVALPVAVISGNYNNGEEPNYTVLSFTYKPHKAGTFPAYIEVKAGDVTLTTEEVELVIAEEELSGEAGTAVNGTTSNTPLNLLYCNSESVSLYTGAMLGLTNGDKINSITWKGYCTDSKEVQTNLSIYYEWTDDASQAQPAAELYNTTGMTAIVENQLTNWEAKGSYSDKVDYIVVNFNDPLVYEEGKNLRLVVRSINPEGMTQSNYKSVTFEKADVTGTWCYAYWSDSDRTLAGTHNAKDLPAIHLGLVVEPTVLEGDVTLAETGELVEGATVTLRNEANDVEYSGTTDAYGHYAINVIQDDLTYIAVADAEGLVAPVKVVESFEDEVDFALAAPEYGEIWDGDAVANVALTAGYFKYLAQDGDRLQVSYTEDAPATKTIKFTKPDSWNVVYMYAWGGDVSMNWPGVEQTETYLNEYNQTVYVCTIPEGATGILFNNNSQQTADITDFNVTGYYTDGSYDNIGHLNVFSWTDPSTAAIELLDVSGKVVATGTLNDGVAEIGLDGDMITQLAKGIIVNVKATGATITSIQLLEPTFYVLEENAEGVEPAESANVKIARNFKQGWNAIVLPFDLSVEEIAEAFGADAEVAYFDGDNSVNGNVSISFKKGTSINHGTPYLLYLPEAKSGVRFMSKEVNDATEATVGDTFNFVGVYAQTTVNTGDMFIKGGKFVTATTNNYVLPFRSYLQLKASGVRSVSIMIGEETITTGIDGLTIESSDNVIYNLGGQKVQNAKKGLYIINGKKVVVK